MDRVAPAHMIWSKRLTFVALALLIIFFNILPLSTEPREWGAPDILVAFCFAWTVRRPEFLPPILLAAVLLLADLLLQRPPGLWALLILLGCEYMRGWGGPYGETGFAAEWLAMAGCLLAATIALRLGLAIVAVPQPSWKIELSQLVLTIAAYPLAAWVSQSLLGVMRQRGLDETRL